MSAAISIENLSVSFPTYGGYVKAVDQVSLQVQAGEIVGLVGESGSGKTITSLTTLGLLPQNANPQVNGVVKVLGDDVLSMNNKQLEQIRGARIALIPQEPMTALNPSIRVGKQINMVIRAHQPKNEDQARKQTRELLEKMGITDSRRVAESFPFELSGGLQQRVLLAMAFSCQPEVLIADEPTTALDVTIQKQVLDLIRLRVKESQVATLFITHDMGVVWELCDRVYVMNQGQVVEHGDTRKILSQPEHPYTCKLLNALPERNEKRQPLPLD